MIYTVSDLHGCYDKYKDLLDKIDFASEDTLYVLGNVIDWGSDGFKILLDMAQQPNVINLMSNHEAMAISAISGIMRGVKKNTNLTDNKAEAVEL